MAPNPFRLCALCAIVCLTACGGGTATLKTSSSSSSSSSTSSSTSSSSSVASSSSSTSSSSASSSSTASVAAADCSFTGSIFSVNGNTAQADYNIYASDGNTIVVNATKKFTVKSGATFNGVSGAIELTADFTSTFTNVSLNSSLGGTAGTPSSTKSYVLMSGTSRSNLGETTTINQASGTSTGTVTFTPAPSWPLNPTLNTAYVNTYEQSSAPVVNKFTTVETTTFLGVEQITVLAGTFAACKIRTDAKNTGGVTTTSYEWVVASGRLKGHSLRTNDANNLRMLESRVLTVNGS